MVVTPALRVVEDRRFRDHVAPRGHPERPERLTAVSEALTPFEDRIERVAPRTAEPEEILRVHGADYLHEIAQAVEHAPTRLDPDTYVSSASLDVALLAAGSACELSLGVARGEARRALAALRPPGHHAESDRAMGFCLFNNVAIAVRAVQATARVDRVMIFDWDVHHGNGTQHSFESDPSVLYVSTHQFPYYPGTGAAHEIGLGAGEGATLNVPLPAGCGDAEYIGAIKRLVVPAARHFAPEMLFISCGFDAHRDDPLASMDVSSTGFLEMSRIVLALADELCDGRVIFLLEGGYAASGLRDGVTALLRAASDSNPPSVSIDPNLLAGSTLRSVVNQVTGVHGSRIPGLGAG